MNALNKLLAKAESAQGLNTQEITRLFLDDSVQPELLRIARQLKTQFKGANAALYTCLYITNFCENDCAYCGFKLSNRIGRVKLTKTQIQEELIAIKQLGISNVILLGGTLPEQQYKELFIEGTLQSIELGLVPWIEADNLSLETLRELKHAGANYFVLFQETYDQHMFYQIHKHNRSKNSYAERLNAPQLALQAGFENIGIGALLGLTNNSLKELIGLYQHAKRLLNAGANVCVSFPSLKSLSLGIDEQVVEKSYVLLRLALPNVSLALSGRESIQLRNELFTVVDQIGTGGVTYPGGRTVYKETYTPEDVQFGLSDSRTPKEVVVSLAELGVKISSRVSWS